MSCPLFVNAHLDQDVPDRPPRAPCKEARDRRPAISAFNERLIAEGHWVFAGGLADPDAATVIDNRGEQAVLSDGPFVESKEYLAGVWVWEAPDLDVALKLATEASKVCDRKIEVRPFQ